MSQSIATLLANVSKAGDVELTKILADLEVICTRMDQLASTGALAPGITSELRLMSTTNRARSKSILFIKEKIKC